MPRKLKSPLSRPLFSEPVFNEGVPTPDPSQFQVTPNDQQFYTKEVEALLTKDVVAFPKASGIPETCFRSRLPGDRTAPTSSTPSTPRIAFRSR